MDAQLPKSLDPKPECIRQFLKGFHSEATKESYAKKLAQFLQACDMTPDELLKAAQKKPKTVQRLIIDHIEERKSAVSGSTINQTVVALKHFLEMNDAEESISWAKISKIMPKVRKTARDRAPTLDEIRQMMQVADTRIRCIILICTSSGIRVGALEEMRWGDLTPIYNRDKSVRAVQLAVYPGSMEEYVTFVSPECYGELQVYRQVREEAGEMVTDSSPLIRDSWDDNKYRKDTRKNPAVATPLAAKTISNMMGKFLKRINIRSRAPGQPRHEFKQIHGFRKFFKTNAERAIKTVDVEKMLGHAESYYKPPEQYLLEQYVKAVPHLAISEEFGLKDQMQRQAAISDRKIGEIERENVSLQDRLAKLESSYGSLKEILEDVLLARTK